MHSVRETCPHRGRPAPSRPPRTPARYPEQGARRVRPRVDHGRSGRPPPGGNDGEPYSRLLRASPRGVRRRGPDRPPQHRRCPAVVDRASDAPDVPQLGGVAGPRVPADRRDDTAQDRGDRLPQDVRRPGRGRPGGDPAVRRCRPGPAGRPRRGAGRRHCHSVRARTIVRYRPLLRAQDPGFPWWGGPDGSTLGPPAPLADPRGRRARVRLRRSGVLHRPGRCRLRELPGNLRSVRGRVPVHARDAAGPRRGRSPRCFAELLGAPRVGHCVGRLRAPGGVRLAVAVRVGPVGVPPSHHIVSARAATPVPSCGRSIPRSRS